MEVYFLDVLMIYLRAKHLQMSTLFSNSFSIVVLIFVALCLPAAFQPQPPAWPR